MGIWPTIDWRSLTVQMVFGFVALVLLTAAAVGLPAISLIRGQVERQAWAQVNQGGQATQALYAATQGKLNDLATLTAQRPTLRQLLNQGDAALLADYLQALQTGTDLNLLKVCDLEGQPLARTGGAQTSGFCESAIGAGYYVLSSENEKQIWLLAADAIQDETGVLGRVVVGVVLDNAFTSEMKSQTGLEHTLLADGQAVASSISGGATSWLMGAHRAVDDDIPGLDQQAEFELGGRPCPPGNIWQPPRSSPRICWPR
jgi:hypothetical protein